MTEIPAGAVTVADLYRELTGLRGDLALALTEIRVMEAHRQSAVDTDRDHETRLRTLERFKWQLMGAAVAVSAAVSGLATWIGLAVTRH